MMIELAAPSVSPLSPEAVAILVNATTAAQYAAQIAAVMAVLSLVAVLALGAAVIWVAYNFSELKHQTNSIMASLLKVTGEEALARGVMQGRGEKGE